MSKQPTLTAFNRTVLELCQQATSDEEAVTYVQDWQQVMDSKCTRKDAQRYIAQAQAAEKAIKEATR